MSDLSQLLSLMVLLVLAALIFPRIFSRRAQPHAGAQTHAPYTRYPETMRTVARDAQSIEEARKHLAARFKRPMLKPTIAITPKMLGRVNVARMKYGMKPLNIAGARNAVAHAWDRPEVRQPDDTVGWLTYLILYECYWDGHQSDWATGHPGLTIDPNMPYNGQGGEFAGAGASSSWAPDDTTPARADAVNILATTPQVCAPPSEYTGPAYAREDLGGRSSVDPSYGATGYSSLDAAVAAGAMPDTSPSSPSDSGSSYSSSSDSGSSSSSSSSSDTGSSGGGDSGGGGGGGD